MRKKAVKRCRMIKMRKGGAALVVEQMHLALSTAVFIAKMGCVYLCAAINQPTYMII
jgi:hypothetical protein